jgi:hypothetical protein
MGLGGKMADKYGFYTEEYVWVEIMRCNDPDCEVETGERCKLCSKVTSIDDHMAISCSSCGSLKFSLLRSEKIECAKCGLVLRDSFWSCNNSKKPKPACEAEGAQS